MRGQSHEINPAKFDVALLQTRGRTFLDQFHDSVTSIDLRFFHGVGGPGRGLNFRHAIGQNLPHAIFFRTECACIQAILNSAAERENTHGENRDSNEHFVEGKTVKSMES